MEGRYVKIIIQMIINSETCEMIHGISWMDGPGGAVGGTANSE